MFEVNYNRDSSKDILENTTKYISNISDGVNNYVIKDAEARKILDNLDLNGSYTPPLLSYQWTDHILNDIRWLRADTFSWQDGGVYFGTYDTLEAEYNNENSVEETDGTITYKRTPNDYKIADISQEEAILNKYNTDGIAWYYIIDTVNKRFKLPRTKYGFTGIRDGVGNDIEAGLPPHTHTRGTMNITGSLISGSGNRGTSRFGENGSSVSGAFYKTSSANAKVLNETDNNWSGFGLGLDASRSWTGETSQPTNEIYGKSDTVQPPATQMYLYFYVGSYTTDAIEQTAGITSEQLNNKLDLDLGNATLETKDVISGLPLPSDRYIDLTLGASGSTYTAPANGWVTCSKRLGANEGLFLLSQNSEGQRLCEYSVRTPSLSDQGGSIPVKKNQTFSVYYDGTGAVEFFRFIYAEGAE